MGRRSEDEQRRRGTGRRKIVRSESVFNTFKLLPEENQRVTLVTYLLFKEQSCHA